MGKMNKLRIKHERELRESEKCAFDHERELRTIFDNNERELRLQNEAAVEKARALQFQIYEQRLESMNEFREQLSKQAVTFLTVDRFEREHKDLTTRLETSITTLGEKLGVESGVTLQQRASHDAVSNLLNDTRLWVIAAVAVLGFLLSNGIIK